MNKVFNISWKVLILQKAGQRSILPILIHYLFCIIKSVEKLYNIFKNMRTETIAEITYTASVAGMEKKLNDGFDFLNRGIYINSFSIDRTFVFTDEDNESPFFVFTDSEYDRTSADYNREAVINYIYADGVTVKKSNFTIYVPISIGINEKILIAMVDKYKKAGMVYNIEYYG